MEIIAKQFSSLEKILSNDDRTLSEIQNVTLLSGESFSYQVCVFTDEYSQLKIEIESELRDYITAYDVRRAHNDWMYFHDSDVITKTDSMIPDILIPLEAQNGYTVTEKITPATIWLKVDLPKDVKAGEYKICANVSTVPFSMQETVSTSCEFDVTVLPCEIPAQSTKYTQWLYTDCIADFHEVPVYSEEHWALIDKYVALARQSGINMILTPVIGYVLDTARNHRRTKSQLLIAKKTESGYEFDFSLVDRWIDMCLANGMEYIEIGHLFSQGGLSYTPNVIVEVDGKEEYLFGWHLPFDDAEYKKFLAQMLTELVAFLKQKNVYDICYFHISDEPQSEHLEKYRYAKDIVAPIVGEEKILDALSHLEFYEMGLVPNPVTATTDIVPFLEKHIEHQWAYCCSGQYNRLGNRFIFMPSYRNRILGLQLYKYDIEGFLHWGYNFYNARRSLYRINPYDTTSCDRGFQSGDAFVVYPYGNGVIPSIRSVVFNEALQDIEVCKLLEKYVGKEKVVELIDSEAGMHVTFFEYPRNAQYIPNLMQKMKNMIKTYLK